MSTFDFVSAFYNKRKNDNTIIRDIDALLSSVKLNVRLIPFGCESKSLEWLDGIKLKNRSVSLLKKSNKLYTFGLKYKYKENGKSIESEGKFFIIQDQEIDDVFVAISLESNEFWKRALHPFLLSLYPRVLFTFITHKKLKRLIENFQNYESYEITIKRASQRLRFQEDPSGRRFMPVVSWPSMSLAESFQWVQEHNGWFESLSFDVCKNNSQLAELSFTRQGFLKADSLIEQSYKDFIKPIINTIHNNLELFSHRSRLERSDLSPRAIVVKFDEDQFTEIAENQKFIQSMRRMKNSSVSVLHGNPYIHLSILDYYDGSAFDLWVLEKENVVIVPQLKVSIAGIKRLINHIFDDFAEGVFTNYDEVI